MSLIVKGHGAVGRELEEDVDLEEVFERREVLQPVEVLTGVMQQKESQEGREEGTEE